MQEILISMLIGHHAHEALIANILHFDKDGMSHTEIDIDEELNQDTTKPTSISNKKTLLH